MAEVLKGKSKGNEVKIHQYCNDWVMSEDGKVYRVTALKYTKDELNRMVADKSTGMMWSKFTPDLVTLTIRKR